MGRKPKAMVLNEGIVLPACNNNLIVKAMADKVSTHLVVLFVLSFEV